MVKLFQILSAAGAKATGWKTTAVGIGICALAASAFYQKQVELGWGMLAVGLAFVFGVSDPANPGGTLPPSKPKS